MTDTIIVRVRAFASAREALGFGDRQMTLAAGTTVSALLAQLAADHPAAGLAQRRLAVAVNRAYAPADTALADGDEVALIPPVSGGSGPAEGDETPAAKRFEITAQPLSLDDVAARVAAADCGGITLFDGTVRGITKPAGTASGEIVTDHLEYEAYAEMAEAVLAQIGAEVQARWPAIRAVCIVHRVGRLAVGEPSVIIAVAAAHREETFAACKYAIDRVKQIAPIWKREVTTDGAAWVEGPDWEAPESHAVPG
jgi:molybdopterin converting factor subunit 1